MANEDSLGDLSVNITGDFSELQDAIDEAVTSATDGASQISDALTQVSDASSSVASDTATSLETISTAATDTAEAIDGISWDDALDDIQELDTAGEGASQSLDGVATAAQDASAGLDEAGSEAGKAAEGAEEAEGGFEGLAEQLTAVGEALVITEGITEFGEEALTAYGAVQSLTIGLTALTGSAEQADQIVEQVKTLAATEPFKFPEIAPTIQQMVAMGVGAKQVAQAMQSVGDAAAATNLPFSTVAQMFERMTSSGVVMTRSLATLGINTDNLGKAMGKTADQVTAAFKALDQEDRITALDTALAKFAGTAIAEAQGIAGQWQIFQNEFEEVMVAVGQALAPVIGDILSFGKTVLVEIEDAVNAFNTLPAPIKDVVIVLGLMVAAIIPITGALAVLSLGLGALNTLIPNTIALWSTLTGSGEALAGSETDAAAATAEHGAAASAATGEVEGLSVAEGENAVAAAESGEATALFGTGLIGALGNIVAFVAAGATLYGTYEEIKSNSADAATSVSELSTWFDRITTTAGGADTSLQALSGTVPQFSQVIADATAYIGGWSGALTSAKDAVVGTTSVIGAFYEIVGQTKDSVDILTGSFRTMQAAADGVAQHAQAAADTMSRSWAAAATAASAGAASAVKVNEAVAGVVSTVAGLQSGVSSASQALAILKNSFQSGIVIPGTQSVATLQQVQAAQVALTKAQKDLAAGLGETAAAAKPAADSLQNLGTKTTEAQTTFDDANTTWANLMTAFNNGQTSLNGVAVNFNTVSQAANDLATAYQKATGAVLVWTNTAASVQAAAQVEINASTTLQNTLNQQLAAYQNLSQAGPEYAIAASLAFTKVQSAAQALGITVTQVGDALQFSFAPGAKVASDAVEPLITNLNKLYGIEVQTINVNGQAVRTFQSLTDTLKDGETAIGQMGQTATVGASGILTLKGSSDQAGQSFDSASRQVINMNGSVTDANGNVVSLGDNVVNMSRSVSDATNAAIKYAQSMQDAADTSDSADDSVSNLVTIENDLIQSADDATGATNEEADAMLALASAADDAADAVDAANTANSKSGKGGGAGGGSLNNFLEDAIGIAQSAASGGALGGGGVTQGYVDQMAQELANATDQVVTTLDGEFIPAAQQAATVTAAQALYTQNNSAATQANTTATTANTTATTASTASTTAVTQANDDQALAEAESTTATAAQTAALAALTSAQNQYETDLSSGTATAAQLTTDLANVGTAIQALGATATTAGTEVTTATSDTTAALSDLATSTATTTSAQQDLSEIAQGQAVTYQTLTGQLGEANDAFNNLIDAQAQYNTAQQDGTGDLQQFGVAVTSAEEALSTFTQGAESAAQSMGTVGSQVGSFTQSLQSAINGGATINGIAPGQPGYGVLPTATPGGTSSSPLAALLGSLTNPLAGPSGTFVPGETSSDLFGQYVNPNAGLMEGYAPSTGTYSGESTNGSGSGVNLTVNVTGNSVTSQALVEQLANRVGSSIITNLRTQAGLKN